MPASQSGIGSFFLERNISMPTGYQILGLQQQQAQHLAAMAAGIPLTYSGVQGYNFIPYPHHRHITHMNNGFDLKAASPYHPALLARGGLSTLRTAPEQPRIPVESPKWQQERAPGR
ncbi:hypothetical protein F7725_001165 [Dissostichus mawsoni]|uniref:Uncharacterized protein n=1 Tax=Dissostichus mawsoni TaxID=36200 RepID=A0A7J5ZGY4_DISMA|nr:hypothetical protein F7725_001165 [Dissostichus mawsoni]